MRCRPPHLRALSDHTAGRCCWHQSWSGAPVGAHGRSAAAACQGPPPCHAAHTNSSTVWWRVALGCWLGGAARTHTLLQGLLIMRCIDSDTYLVPWHVQGHLMLPAASLQDRRQQRRPRCCCCCRCAPCVRERKGYTGRRPELCDHSRMRSQQQQTTENLLQEALIYEWHATTL